MAKENNNKSFVLRIDAATMEALEGWAADEFRSINGQLQWIIADALRRSGRLQSQFVCAGVALDASRGVVTRNGAEVPLSALEYRLLLTLFSNRGTVLPRERLLSEIWDASGEFVNDNTLTVYIKRLREKLEDDPQSPALIRTVRGVGYRLGP